MAGSIFDGIIRKILGMPTPSPDDANPFHFHDPGSLPDAPVDVPAAQPELTMREGDLPPLTDLDLQRMENVGPSQQLPYFPGRDRKFTGPMIIPNNPNDRESDPNRPLKRGNSKYGSGIDV